MQVHCANRQSDHAADPALDHPAACPTCVPTAAMSAGALWRVMGKAPFRLDMIKDSRFARVFGAAVVLHMIWNSPWNLPFEGKDLLLGVVAWIIVLGLVQEGLEELQAAKAASGVAAAAPR
ncbi:MAG TPA: hypothetical protein VGT07_03175 [Steroidobacteraceae bacterium]|nr:hypothetical protein [Steroidobacteraceae bacterium]